MLILFFEYESWDIAKTYAKKEITNNAELANAKFALRQLHAQTSQILNTLTSPKRGGNTTFVLSENGIYLPEKAPDTMILSSETINSAYLKKLAQTLEDVDEKVWAYETNKIKYNEFESPHVLYFSHYNSSINKPEINYYDEFGSEQDKPGVLRMYAAYLKSRKNPKVLNNEELKRIKKHSFKEDGFELEISDEKYKKYNQILEKTPYFLLNCIIMPVKGAYLVLNKVKEQIDSFFDKYKYKEDGQIPYEKYKNYKNKSKK
ncbi:MAG: hypothetical protein ACLFN8_00200 [Candidatus Woesearchaeota archaeon]